MIDGRPSVRKTGGYLLNEAAGPQHMQTPKDTLGDARFSAAHRKSVHYPAPLDKEPPVGWMACITLGNLR